MLTQCPNCSTIFRINSTILRTANGQVRCGQCNHQFDAVRYLIDEQELGLSATTPEAQNTAAHLAHEQITLEGKRIEISGIYPSLDSDSDEQPFVQTIVQEFAGEEFAEHSEADEPAPSGTASNPDSTPALTSPITFDFAAKPRSASVHHLRWTTLSITLVVLLVLQVVHHYRHELARYTIFDPIRRAYTVLNLPLEPHWLVSAYVIQQWGVISDPADNGSLRVRASVTNKAKFAQPHPQLKLTLEDRFGQIVGARQFKPQEYLTTPEHALRPLKSGESANIDITIVDPGKEAVGFHLNACLPRLQGNECTG